MIREANVSILKPFKNSRSGTRQSQQHVTIAQGRSLPPIPATVYIQL
ncbi:MAG: hypothetical protein LBL39_07055 [Planctomycetaceae bacterium]|nr:hypothetical protein [Planctomycetaceae bacterium]